MFLGAWAIVLLTFGVQEIYSGEQPLHSGDGKKGGILRILKV